MALFALRTALRRSEGAFQAVRRLTSSCVKQIRQDKEGARAGTTEQARDCKEGMIYVHTHLGAYALSFDERVM
ncbi:hypothetical protein LshimejAT787_0701670 [Lyophyllum shimeji]|uniref:Uncharacterized protein n=1 Tax=Lyophyllum shimeji TaxID=47721 RepID=A0A9P3UNT5_LYOSH|nr:hypothetical protein LshimejAT787_0701670 [Lyophyllum shimeji]